jgi:hypothetical protein
VPCNRAEVRGAGAAEAGAASPPDAMTPGEERGAVATRTSVLSSSDVSGTTTRSGKREAEAAELDRGAAEAAELDRGAAELDRKASAGGRAS